MLSNQISPIFTYVNFAKFTKLSTHCYYSYFFKYIPLNYISQLLTETINYIPKLNYQNVYLLTLN